ncbi:DUF982 domain-containing protein [Devosia sp. A449]
MRPVFLRLKQSRTGNYQARNASEAMEYLKLFWPGARTGEYRRAKAMCRSALDNLVSAESARNYLIAAAERAGILDRVVNQSSVPPAHAAA